MNLWNFAIFDVFNSGIVGRDEKSYYHQSEKQSTEWHFTRMYFAFELNFVF
jgi:hypothetical protein